tara:strand:+ start:1079 stop:1729 length:651 start_codon:yes stop_codon:yes gene_type:complete
MIKLDRCKLIFLDFDGVIVDSNKFKELAIKKSLYDVIGRTKKTEEALNYFNKYAGVSRKVKLSKFFKNSDIYKILEQYEKACKSFFQKAEPTIGFKEFIKYIKINFKKIRIFILSGGEKQEIIDFLQQNNIFYYFEDILSSNKTKQDHLKDFKVSKNDIFIGDSLSDLKASTEIDISFILLENFKSKESFPSEELIKKHVLYRTNNFKTFLDKIIT